MGSKLTSNTLYAHDKNGFRTFFRSYSGTVPDGMLRFYAEEETGSETVHTRNTWCPRFCTILQIT